VKPSPSIAAAGLMDAAAAHYAAGRLDEAARLYRRAEAADPTDVRPAYSLAVIDVRRGRPENARRRLCAVVAREPGLFAAQQNLGAVSEDLGRWSEAAEAYDRALVLRPDAAETRFGLARALAVLGRLEEAIGCYRALAADPPSRVRALIRLAVLDARVVEDGELADLRRAADDPDIEAKTRIELLFALGAVLEHRRADDEAFAAFSAGNGLKHAALIAAGGPTLPGAVSDAHARTADFIEALFTDPFIARHAGAGHPSAAPIFVVGMPRSGSSLIEQILSSHRDVQGMGESAALSGLIDRGFPGAPGRPDRPSGWRRLAEAYLAAMRGLGWKDHARFVDKTLENHLRVGLIHLMFPRAVVLHSVRDPVDACLACYRQLFASGNETLYDLRQIGEAYVRYRRVMAHWDAVLPGRVIAVDHEALVADPEDRIRWLVTEACGLDWDPDCLKFDQSKGAVSTASAAQVRRPMFMTSIQRWRRHEAHLGPLFEALGPYAPGAD